MTNTELLSHLFLPKSSNFTRTPCTQLDQDTPDLHSVPIKVTNLQISDKVHQIKPNYINTYPYVLQTIVQSVWIIRLSVTQKSNCKQNHFNVRLYN